jgi:hypothetical protein
LDQVTVRCTVDNCHYWGRGNVCDAREILVTSEQVARKYPANVDTQQLSAILEEVGETPTGSSEETCCKTFRPKS